MHLPILTFEQGALSPALGYVFHRKWVQPYESIIGILWKFSGANALPGHLLLPQLIDTPIDPYEGILPNANELDIRRVARQLGLLQKTVRSALAPTQAGLGGSHSPILRYCLKCLRLGYHGVVHQRLGTQQCPVHGDWLEEVCRGCGQRAEYRLNVAMLDASFRCCHCRRVLGSWTSATARGLHRKHRTAVTRAFLRC